MADQLDKYRWLNIFLAVALLASMGIYAYFKMTEILSFPYRFDENTIASNGSRILDTSVNSFTVKWQYNQPKTFFVQSPPAFKVGDMVSQDRPYPSSGCRSPQVATFVTNLRLRGFEECYPTNLLEILSEEILKKQTS